MWAARERRVETVLKLIERGADLHAQKNNVRCGKDRVSDIPFVHLIGDILFLLVLVWLQRIRLHNK